MVNKFVEVVNTLLKEKPVLCFTRVCQPLPKWCPDCVYNGSYAVPYGYYEIKNSSMGPIMLHIGRQSEYWRHVDITIKVADRGWTLSKCDAGPGTERHGDCSAVYDLIEASKRYPSDMSPERAIKKWEHFCDNPKPSKEAEKEKPAEPVKGPTALEALDAFMKVLNRHRPFEPSDSIPESFIADINDRQR